MGLDNWFKKIHIIIGLNFLSTIQLKVIRMTFIKKLQWVTRARLALYCLKSLFHEITFSLPRWERITDAGFTISALFDQPSLDIWVKFLEICYLHLTEESCILTSQFDLSNWHPFVILCLLLQLSLSWSR